jgi:hypothetical protein
MGFIVAHGAHAGLMRVCGVVSAPGTTRKGGKTTGTTRSQLGQDPTMVTCHLLLSELLSMRVAASCIKIDRGRGQPLPKRSIIQQCLAPPIGRPYAPSP